MDISMSTSMSTPSQWENHPTIIRYHTFMNSGRPWFSSDERRTIAEAYSLHDQHFGISLSENIQKFCPSVDSLTHSIGQHIGKFLQEHPEHIHTALTGDVTVCMQYYQPPPNTSGKLYNELMLQINQGVVTDLLSFYNYMCTYHLDEVLSSGW